MKLARHASQFAALAAMVALLTALSGCGGPSASTDSSELDGSWTLESLGGVSALTPADPGVPSPLVHEAAQAMRRSGFGIKAATITPEGADDVGSPNRILREEVQGKVIIRTGRRIPGITPVAGVHYPISIVRMAVEDAYGAEQWRGLRGDAQGGDG